MIEPIILADNRFLDGEPQATTTAVGFDVRHPVDLRPYTFWQAAAAGVNYYSVDCGAERTADCLAIIGHNLHTAAAVVTVERSVDGIAWIPCLDPFTPASDRAFMRPFLSVSGSRWRLKIATAALVPYLAVVMVGNRLQFPYPPDGGVPFTESVVEESAESKTGQPLGTVVRYYQLEIRKDFSFVPREWVETVYLPWWRDHGRKRKYFFFAEDLDLYPDAVFFVCHTGKHAPSVTSRLYYDKLQLEMKGTAEP